MFIQRLQVAHVRNLSRIALPRLGPVNVFFGVNGSGKTSLLEAIHLLLLGKSFRHTNVRPLLQDGAEDCTVFAELRDERGQRLTLGAQRYREGSKPLLKINGAPATGLAELAEQVPLQVLAADSFDLLLGGPSFRREFIDRGLFHVEPEFYPAWRLAQRALKQRNSLIRHGKIPAGQLELWSREYARYGEQIDALRRAYVEQLVPCIARLLDELSPAAALSGIEVAYSRGWNKEQPLEEVLLEGMERDMAQGFTRAGPHRAELRVAAPAGLVADTLSRGQLKILVAAFHLAQAELQQRRTGKRSLFLIDDVAAELDRPHRIRLSQLLERLELQVFATCLEPADLQDCWSGSQVQMFHVERGDISPVPAGANQGN